ncbi:MAG TPA: citrate/2-methylcitrate synthase [Aggregatilineales bacterium]|nr:citrate/2-methylcitrate synthase [Aggregatilineales bacterium]
MPDRYLSAEDACALLGIKAATLYAYVSRGLIRSESSDDSSRERRYLTEDVEALARRKAERKDPATVARSALDWGSPLLDSELTLIDGHRLYYRGLDATVLAREWSLEQVAALLWLDDRSAAQKIFTAAEQSRDTIHGVRPEPVRPDIITQVGSLGLPPLNAMQVALALAVEEDVRAFDLSRESVAQTGARILHLLTAAVITSENRGVDADGNTAQMLAQAWQVDAVALLNAALVLCADHELNASSFAGRITASAEATPYAVVLAGLAALSGVRHGAHTARVRALLESIPSPEQARPVLRDRLRRGEDIPGFGHRLYLEGDPRADTLLGLLQEIPVRTPFMASARERIDAARSEGELLTGKLVSVDFALVALELTLGLPRGSALTLFALGRTVGWIAHAIEQYESGQLLRPRARYTGRAPQRDG